MFDNLTFLEGRFGMEPLFPIAKDHIHVIHNQYQGYLDPETFLLDETTWNDLDLDKIYTAMNSTYSGGGDIMLYTMLRTPCLNKHALTRRYNIMKWATTQEEEREDAIRCLYTIGKRYGETMDQALLSDRSNPLRGKRSILYVILLFLSILLAVFIPNPFFFFMIGMFLFNICRAAYLHKTLEKEINALVYVLAHMKGLHELAKLPFTGLDDVSKEFQEMSEGLSNIHSKYSLNYFEKSINAMNFIFQSESIYYDKFAALIHEKQSQIRKAIALIGTIDACIAAASYVEQKKLFTDVQLVEKGAFIDAKKMVHPLLSNPIFNDIDIHEHRMITGSNATGKSTYLKMVALNVIFAQSFHFAFASTYRASYFQIATSMSLVDDLLAHDSTFVAEVKSLMHLLSLERKDIPTLCMVDEILRGTNTQERIASSSVILKLFAQRNYLCMSATHDMELTKMLASLYKNYYFCETMKDHKMFFDYKIHEGASKTRNAIKLLALLGYKNTLTTNAQQRLQNFESSGSWEVIA